MIQTLLFTAGLNTLLQTTLGSRLPSVMRASFVFTLPVLSIINDFSDRTFATEHEVYMMFSCLAVYWVALGFSFL